MRSKSFFFAVLLAASTAVLADHQSDDINPDVTQDNLRHTVCVPGYTKTIRPDVDYTNAIKRRLLPPGERMRDYQLDHNIPLGVGGHPSHRSNLFLQPLTGKCGAKRKDIEEARWHRALCAGKVTLAQARAHFAHWSCRL